MLLPFEIMRLNVENYYRETMEADVDVELDEECEDNLDATLALIRKCETLHALCDFLVQDEYLGTLEDVWEFIAFAQLAEDKVG